MLDNKNDNDTYNKLLNDLLGDSVITIIKILMINNYLLPETIDELLNGWKKKVISQMEKEISDLDKKKEEKDIGTLLFGGMLPNSEEIRKIITENVEKVIAVVESALYKDNG
jgi:hypothetical protein